MDIVFIEKLTVMTKIGVYDWEQHQKQKLVLDLEMGWENYQAAVTDNLQYCLNYAQIGEVVVNYIEAGSFLLIERVAEEIANLLITHFHTPWVKVKVAKPGAVSYAEQVGVIIERRMN